MIDDIKYKVLGGLVTLFVLLILFRRKIKGVLKSKELERKKMLDIIAEERQKMWDQEDSE